MYAFHSSSVWADIFWFHRTLDHVDPHDSKLVAAGMLAFFLLATMVCERRSYRAPETVRDALPDARDSK